MYKLKIVNGKVNVLFKSGNDFVKSIVPISAIQHLINRGRRTKSDIQGYPICIDNVWFFEGEEEVSKRKRKGKSNA